MIITQIWLAAGVLCCSLKVAAFRARVPREIEVRRGGPVWFLPVDRTNLLAVIVGLDASDAVISVGAGLLADHIPRPIRPPRHELGLDRTATPSEQVASLRLQGLPAQQPLKLMHARRGDRRSINFATRANVL